MVSIVVDMHTHTTCSDGVLTPAELVRKAEACGLQTLSITDHDTIAGIEPARREAVAAGIEIVSGVELSVRVQGRELHILGYCFDLHYEGLQRFLAGYQQLRTHRARAMVVRLNALGVPLDFDDVQSLAEGPAIGRPHVARALLKEGYVSTMEEAFLKYLRNGGPADVAKELPPAEEAIAMLHEAGGVAVLAHPGHWVTDRDIDRLKSLGLDGVEIIHPSHDEMLVAFYTDVAHRLSLLTTGGSDFHGMRSNDQENFGAVGFTREQFRAFQLQCAA